MTSYRILAVENDPSIRILLRRTLRDAGHSIRYTDWTDLPDDAASRDHDALLLDLMGTDTDLELIAAVKQQIETPVVVLSTREASAQRTRALDCGADDFLSLPLDPADLVTRIRVAVKRLLTKEGGVVCCRAGDVRIDLLDRTVTKDEQPVSLSRKEFMLLARLARFPGRLIPHEQMIWSLWGRRRKNSIAYLRTLVRSLRSKLEEVPACPRIIENATGSGYRLRATPA